jgi:hypothetical protein
MLLFISLLYVKNRPKIKHNKIKRNIKRYEDSNIIIIILYIVHYLYFIFFIVSTIIAIIHIAKGKNNEITDSDYYIFNTTFFILILIINVLLLILPSFLKATNIISKGFIYYILIILPNSTCFFHLPYLFTCMRNIDSKRAKIESIYILFYILLNGILTVFCLVFDTKRQRRMDFFFIIVIIFTVINGAKLIIVVIGSCCQNRFNKNISNGDIPQYIINNDVHDYNNIKNLNIGGSSKIIPINSSDKKEINNISNYIYPNNNSNLNENNKVINDNELSLNIETDNMKDSYKINGKTSNDSKKNKKHDFNKSNTNLKKNKLYDNFNLNKNNNENRRNYSHKSKLKSLDINQINKEAVKKNQCLTNKDYDIIYINNSLKSEKEKEESNFYNISNNLKDENDNIKVSEIKYPMDSVIDDNNKTNDKNDFSYTIDKSGHSNNFGNNNLY